MTLLFDQNLSHRLTDLLADLYPGSLHVRDVGMAAKDDAEIWAYAREENLVLVSKDSDFQQRSFLYGHPPKFIWLRVGNCSTRGIADLLRRFHTEVLSFTENPVDSYLALG